MTTRVHAREECRCVYRINRRNYLAPPREPLAARCGIMDRDTVANGEHVSNSPRPMEQRSLLAESRKRTRL